MNEKRVKKLRKYIYGESSVAETEEKEPRSYAERGRTRVCIGKRKEYQNYKRLIQNEKKG